MLQKLHLAILVLAPVPALAQSLATADRSLNVQVGVLLSQGNPGIAAAYSTLYGKSNYTGGGIYADIDTRLKHLGVELAARQISGGKGVNERTYEVGPRYYRPIGRFTPYAKVLVGKGVFNFPRGIGSRAFNEGALGAGIDYRLSNAIHVRGDYEYQRWFGFAKVVTNYPGSLSPAVVSVGVAYHFY